MPVGMRCLIKSDAWWDEMPSGTSCPVDQMSHAFRCPVGLKARWNQIPGEMRGWRFTLR